VLVQYGLSEHVRHASIACRRGRCVVEGARGRRGPCGSKCLALAMGERTSRRRMEESQARRSVGESRCATDFVPEMRLNMALLSCAADFSIEFSISECISGFRTAWLAEQGTFGKQRLRSRSP
jgi:hypothetical protein